MISWNKHAYNQYGVLQVRDEELEDFAYSQLKDYKKIILKPLRN